ncbi:MAG: TorF family putative porin [Marinagarivorans sp.]|nr:TorF family putative porin [Marinagarivorans sp.]
MKVSKTLLASSVAAVLSAGFMAPAFAAPEVGASVGVASTYLWRGSDLGRGTPAVFGDLNVSAAGFYGGIWGSSGDAAAGTEYDLYAGYGGSVGDFSYGASLWSYNYPTGSGYDKDGETDFTDWSDAVVTLGYGPVSFNAYIPVGKGNSSGDYMYYTLGASIGAFSVLVGMHSDAPNVSDGPTGGCSADETSDSCSPVHLNVSYAYNDNLSFTVSQFIADETEADDMKFVVSYTMPLGE